MARNPPPPLTPPTLDRLALRYVERFATTRGKLADYLRRKLRERGWAADAEPEVEALIERFVDLGYIDDRAYGQAKAAAMGRRGLGARRVDMALRQAGLNDADREAAAPDDAGQAIAAAIGLARRKRIGPYGTHPPEAALRQKQLAQMVRAGHDFRLSRKIVDWPPMSGSEEISEVERQLMLSFS